MTSWAADSVKRNLDTVNMMICRMEKLGLVELVWSEKDRREVHVSLTPLGKNKLGKGIDVGGTQEIDRGSGSGDEAIEEWMLLMGKLVNQLLKEMERAPVRLDVDSTQSERVIEVFQQRPVAEESLTQSNSRSFLRGADYDVSDGRTRIVRRKIRRCPHGRT